jgi:hypothetical protein
VNADRVRAGEDGGRDEVVSIEQAARDGLADAVDIDGRGGGESGKESKERGERGGEEGGAGESDVEPVRRRGRWRQERREDGGRGAGRRGGGGQAAGGGAGGAPGLQVR